MGIVVALMLALGGVSGLPLDGVLPEPVAARVRMLSIREGVTDSEVYRRLDLNDRFPAYAYGTLSTFIVGCPAGQTHTLRLVFHRGEGDDLRSPMKLHKATLVAKDAK